MAVYKSYCCSLFFETMLESLSSCMQHDWTPVKNGMREPHGRNECVYEVLTR